uniref:Uncharacterized protein n=1 Tax=Arundo donax TaxID=35708 RepID=A0A0A9HNF3_ARUDO
MVPFLFRLWANIALAFLFVLQTFGLVVDWGFRIRYDQINGKLKTQSIESIDNLRKKNRGTGVSLDGRT